MHKTGLHEGYKEGTERAGGEFRGNKKWVMEGIKKV